MFILTYLQHQKILPYEVQRLNNHQIKFKQILRFKMPFNLWEVLNVRDYHFQIKYINQHLYQDILQLFFLLHQYTFQHLNRLKIHYHYAIHTILKDQFYHFIIIFLKQFQIIQGSNVKVQICRIQFLLLFLNFLQYLFVIISIYHIIWQLKLQHQSINFLSF